MTQPFGDKYHMVKSVAQKKWLLYCIKQNFM